MWMKLFRIGVKIDLFCFLAIEQYINKYKL